MNVFVTGATGFVGREVVAELGRQGHRAYCLVRNPKSSSARQLANQGHVRLFEGDLVAEPNLASSLAGCDAVIHLVGIIAEAGRNTFQRAHVEATRTVVEAARSARVNRYLHMSALGTRPDAVSTYHRTKWAAEEIVRSSGLAWTILRPSLIHGPADDFVNRFARMSAYAPFLPVIGPGTFLLQPVSVRAVARCFVAALTCERAVGQVYELCGDERLTLVQVLDVILQAAGRRRLKLHLPVRWALALAGLMAYVWPRWFHRAPPLNRDQVLMLQEHNVGDPEPARRLFGLEPEQFTRDVREYVGPCISS